MILHFSKMHGLGNDFMIVDLISQNAYLMQKKISTLSDRRYGIGFDQLLLVKPPNDPEMDFYYQIFNADGSEALQCGNGARCFFMFVKEKKLTYKNKIQVQTKNGHIEMCMAPNNNVTVNMGRPAFEPYKVPFLCTQQQTIYSLTIDNQTFQANILSMGNPHVIIHVDNIKNAPVDHIGSELQTHKKFPDGCNVSFAQIINRNEIRLRVYERGVGETPACGSGACAAVVAGIINGELNRLVTTRLTSGFLEISWPEDGDLLMTGPATWVYDGFLQI